MAEGTRLNQLQEGLNSLKQSTDSQLQNLETEMLALKRQSNSVMQQLSTLIELQRKNNGESFSDGAT